MIIKILGKLKAFSKAMYIKCLAPFYRAYPPRLHVSLLDPLGIISTSSKFAYFRIFKAANSTIVATLYHAQYGKSITSLEELQPIKDDYYARPSQLSLVQVREMRSSYFKFTFVRNPYTRVLAAYFDKVIPKDQGKHKMVTNFLGKPSDSEISFDEFLTYLEKGGINHNAHWARQSDLLSIPLDEFNLIGKTETISVDLPHVLGIIFGGEHTIISVREHTTGSSRKVEELDSVTRNRIKRLYELDFHNFRYMT